MVFLRLLAFCVCAALLAADPSASSHFRKGRKAQRKGDLLTAFSQYSQAFALDPTNRKYWAYLQAVQRPALQQTRFDLPPATEIESTGGTSLEEMRVLPELLPPPELKVKPGRQDFDLTGDSNKIFEKVAAAFGLVCVFDADFQPSKPFRFHIEQADALTAFHALESITGAFLVPVNERAILVAKDTAQKRQELEPTMAVTVPVPEGVTPQDLQEVANAVRTAFDLTKVGFDNGRKLLVLRDRISRVRPAVAVVNQLLRGKASVFVEVTLLAVNRSSNLSAGLTLQSAFTLSPLVATMRLGQGLPGFAVSITGAQLFAALTRGQGHALTTTGLLALDGQQAQFNSGTRYPVLTQGYFGGTATSADTTVYRPPPTVQFYDLGVVLKITPRIHDANELSMEIDAEYKALTGQVVNDIPVIASRQITTRARMRFDEYAVLAGLVDDSIQQSWSGLPLLSAFPGARSNTKDRLRDEVLVVLRPRLISLPGTEYPPPRPLWVGTETRPLPPLTPAGTTVLDPVR